MALKGYNLKSLAQLFKELDQDFVRLHKQIWFDLQLPFDKEKYKTFKDILPKEKFVPVQDRLIQESEKVALIKIPNRAFAFEDLLKTVSKKLHQANPLKLDVLKMAYAIKQNIKNMNLLQFQFNTPLTREELINKHKDSSQVVVKALQNGMFDC